MWRHTPTARAELAHARDDRPQIRRPQPDLDAEPFRADLDYYRAGRRHMAVWPIKACCVPLEGLKMCYRRARKGWKRPPRRVAALIMV